MPSSSSPRVRRDLSWMMDFMWSASMAEHAGAAKRRRERRLRAYLRYARMSVAMALAESNHHAAPRGRNMARTGVEGHEEQHSAPRRQKPLPPQLPQRADAGTQTVTEQDVQVAIPQEHTSERIMEQTVDAPFPQAMEGIVESEYVAPAAAMRRRTGKYVAPAPAAACAAPATVKECVASSPDPVIKHVASALAAT